MFFYAVLPAPAGMSFVDPIMVTTFPSHIKLVVSPTRLTSKCSGCGTHFVAHTEKANRKFISRNRAVFSMRKVAI